MELTWGSASTVSYITFRPLRPSDCHFRDWKVSMILKASFQNWVPSKILVAGSMCQIIPVRLVRFSYFKVFISEGVSNIG